MPDNLTIQIGADTSKLRADLLVAQAELRKFTSDVNKNVRAGDTAGAAASAASGALAAEKAVALKTALAGSNIEAAALTSRLRDGARELEHIRGQFRGGFEGLLGNAAGGLSGKALGIGLGLAALGELGKLVGETAEKAHKMEVVSEALGVSTGQMRDWTKAAGAAHVPAEILDQLLERLAISAEKAANEQRKLRVETAQIIAKDSSFGIVARGGLSTPPPKLSSQLVDNALMPSLAGQGAGMIHDDEALQNRLEMRAAKFREFAKAEFEVFKKAQEGFDAAGQAPPPLPSFDSFERNLRSRMGQPTKEGEDLRTKFAQQGGDAPARDFSEMLKRLEPGFKDAFTKHNIALLDTEGKLRAFEKALVDTTIAMSHMDKGELLSFGKETMQRQVIKQPQALAFFRGEGEKEGGIFKEAASRPDKDIETLSGLAKTGQSVVSQMQDFGFTVGGAVVRAVQDLVKPIGEAEGDAKGLATELGGLGAAASGIAPVIADFEQLKQTLRDVRDLARSTAAAVGAAMGGGGGNPFSDTGEDIPRFAQGGLFSGRPGRDTNLAWMTDGEYVINRDSARRIGLSTLNAMNFGRHLPRYASGGAVGSISSGGHLGTVHLTLDGQTHSLRADRQNFEGIVQYARTRRLAQIAPRPANAT